MCYKINIDWDSVSVEFTNGGMPFVYGIPYTKDYLLKPFEKCVSYTWVQLSDLQEWYNILISTPFSNDLSRQDVLMQYGKIPRVREICSWERRFPDKSMVCLGNEKISDIILKITELLNVGAPNNEFFEKIRSLNKAIISGHKEYGIFTRRSFEEEFTLSWVNEEQ